MDKRTADKLTAAIQLFLCGLIAALSFKREIKAASEVTNKLKKRRTKKEAKALKNQKKIMMKTAKKGGIA